MRNVIDPARDLGHVDRDHKKEKAKKDTPEYGDVPAAREGETGGEETKKGDLSHETYAEHLGAIGKSLNDEVATRSTGPAAEDEPKTMHEDAEKVREKCEDCA